MKLQDCRTTFKMEIITFLSLISVEPVMLLSNIASFMQIGILQDFTYLKVCLQHYDPDTCNAQLQNKTLNVVQNESSIWMRYTNMAVTFPSIFTCLYLGSWCSKYGARTPLLITSIGGILSNIVNEILAIYMDSSVAYIIISQFVAGLTGASICVTMACMSYVSLLTTPENRTVRLSVLEAMMFLGAMSGPFIGGAVLEKTSHRTVFILLSCIYAVTAVYILIRVKNISPSSVNLQEADVPRIAPKPTLAERFHYSHFIGTVTICFVSREHGRRMCIIFLLVTATLIMLCTAGESDTTYLYAKNKPLVWSYTTYSYFSGAKYAVGSFMLLFGLPVIRRLTGIRDTTLGIVGILSRMAGLLLLSLSKTTTAMFFVPLAAMFSNWPIPAVRSLLSKVTEPKEHGKVFAFVACCENFAYFVAALIFNSVYPATRGFFAGFVFVLAVIILIVPLVIMCMVHISKNRSDSSRGWTEILAADDASTETFPEESGYRNLENEKEEIA